MVKRIFMLLILAYFCYSFLVYTKSAKETEQPTDQAIAGLSIWQSRNCQACHQLYGLGGYMGPDLTNIISDSTKGALFAKSLLIAGSPRMPNFNLSETDITNLLAFLSWVDKSGKTAVPAEKVTWYGNYNIDNQ
jgi:nitric oxide reductase subunit C